ncbi:uncharacterized protein GlcG (DUF336 family) [Pedobacter sp. CAN_A7]|uniref:heme-binding protein n=1 Tax=Pedobacter sp. CAN_A7 TaxID=2787722 RepID=UPI0018CB4081
MILKSFIVFIFMALPVAAFAQDKNNEDQYLTTNRQLTLKSAYALAETARAKAAAMGKQVSIAILDQSGVTILITGGDGVGPHNTEAARRKAYTALSTKTATLTLARNAKMSGDSETYQS